MDVSDGMSLLPGLPHLSDEYVVSIQTTNDFIIAALKSGRILHYAADTFVKISDFSHKVSPSIPRAHYKFIRHVPKRFMRVLEAQSLHSLMQIIHALLWMFMKEEHMSLHVS